MPVPISGLPSVADRTLYTNRGPIVKKPVALLSGVNLRVVSETEIVIPTGSFGTSTVGRTISISGSPNGRNDGTFLVSGFRSSTRLVLKGASFDYSNVVPTVAQIVALANDLKAKVNAHVMTADLPPAVHESQDILDTVSFEDSVDLPSAIILLNLLRTAFLSHIVKVGPAPSVHSIPDTANTVFYPTASGFPEAVLLANELRIRFESHRDALIYHGIRDVVNRVTAPSVSVVKGSGPLTGPFPWTLSDPRYGQIADSPLDVTVRVNGSPAPVDAVFGLMGAVVLATRPASTDSVTIDYSWLDDPPVQIERLNSPEFALNQAGGKGLSGFPGHKYKVRSTLVDPANPRTVRSPSLPVTTGWKYKGLERSYTASLNDPNLLLTNVPNNRVAYQVLATTASETVIRYDPTTLPENSSDPWTLKGTGSFSLAPDGSELTIVDPNFHAGPGEDPPFYTHKADFTFPSTVSAAFRARVVEATIDGSFTGVGFGVADGSRTALIGFIETDANNLSSGISLANSVKAKYGAHLMLTGTHLPNDPSDAVDVVDAKDLPSLIVLANRMKALYNSHAAKGLGTVHVVADPLNSLISPDAKDLPTALALTNETASKYAAHRTASGVHYVDDLTNVVGPVRQVGILTSRGFPEDASSWNSSAADWTVVATYRLHRDQDGNVSLYVSGSVVAAAATAHKDLPSTSDLDIRIDPAQQVFFGAVWRGSSSTSGWSFIRANVIPTDYNQIADNKSVLYDAVVVPELDPVAPWVVLGQGGTERILSGPNLVVDSTSSVPRSTVDALGLTTGEYRGYLRSEPILSVRTTSAIEFTASVSYWTFSLDNKGAGLFVDDGTFSTHLVFLQHMPSPATVTGTSTQPFPIAAFDSAILSIGSSQSIEVVFPAPVTTAAQVVAVINAAVGFALASDDGSGRVRFTDVQSGSSSKLVMLGGTALEKFGVALGTYFGRDSNPEPKISWFGESLPDEDVAPWAASGGQQSSMFGRTMRVSDSSTSDFRSYTESDPLFTAPILDPSFDWKLDARLRVLSFTAGDQVMSGTNLRFAGSVLNVDEGPAGKNVEVQTSVDNSGVPFLNVLSYNPGTGALDQKAVFPFAWDDGKPHTLNVFTSKGAGLCVVLADGVALGTFSYVTLNQGFSGPSVSFGSGGSPVANGDLRTALSVTDWSSVALFKDSKLSDPLAPSRRFAGIYSGGDPSLLSSYYLTQVDWTVPHLYRIVRDPVNGVSVFLDGSSIASISVSYDSLKLPPSSSSFLKEISDSRQVVTFGGFDPVEMSRTVWGPIKYSLGKMTITDRRVPPHQVLNQGNAYASPDHLYTKVPHRHAGFRVYSGGTPLDEFMYDQRVRSFTNLGEGTPPVPMTQDLESRGGLVRTAVQTSTADPLDYVNTRGYITDLVDDTFNAVNVHSPVDDLIGGAVAMVNAFNLHLASVGIHVVADTVNTVVILPPATLTDAIVAVNAVATAYAAHRFQAGVHVLNDGIYAITAPPATDVQSLLDLANDFTAMFHGHVERVVPHVAVDVLDNVLSPNASNLATLVTLANDLSARYGAHRSYPGAHVNDDLLNVVAAPLSFDLPTAVSLVNDVKAKYDAHALYVAAAATPLGSHKGVDRFNQVSTADSVDLPTAMALANALKSAFNLHLVQQDSHLALDTVADAFVFADAYNDLEPGGHPEVLDAADLLEDSLYVLKLLRAAFNRHLVQKMVHVANDQKNSVAVPDPVDLPTAIAVTNLLKLRFNAHRTSVSSDSGAPVHVNDDLVDAVVLPDADDLSSMIALLEEIQHAHNAHLVRLNVHGSTVFIKIDPPPRVRYQGTRFFRSDSGREGLVKPFYDGGGPEMGPLSAAGVHTLSYEGGSFPERVNLVGSAFAPYTITAADPMIVTIGSVQYSVVFQAGDVTVALVAARINLAPGMPAGTASDNGDGRVRLTAPSPGVAMSASGVGAVKLGLDGAQSASWFLVSDDPGAVTVSLMTAGPTDFLRYQTDSPGTRTVYRARTGLTDAPSVDYVATFTVRINTFTTDADGDTGIYVGVSGATGLGYTAAVGFDSFGGVKYVKIQDLNSGTTLFRRAFNWADGNFHTYRLVRRSETDSLSLVIVS